MIAERRLRSTTTKKHICHGKEFKRNLKQTKTNTDMTGLRVTNYDEYWYIEVDAVEKYIIRQQRGGGNNLNRRGSP